MQKSPTIRAGRCLKSAYYDQTSKQQGKLAALRAKEKMKSYHAHMHTHTHTRLLPEPSSRYDCFQSTSSRSDYFRKSKPSERRLQRRQRHDRSSESSLFSKTKYRGRKRGSLHNSRTSKRERARETAREKERERERERESRPEPVHPCIVPEHGGKAHQYGP